MAKTTFSRYDTADYLKTEEDIALYMEAVMEEGGDDPGFIVHALGDVARARNMSQLARETGMTREGLYKALSGRGNPSFATVTKVAGALGLRLSFQPAGQSASAKPTNLLADDAGMRLRQVIREPARLHGKVKAGTGH